MKTYDGWQSDGPPEPLPPYVKKLKDEADMMRYCFDTLREETNLKIGMVWVVLVPVCVAIGFLIAKVF